MRKETITISERNLMFAVGGQLFDQAPNRQPRKAQIIMKKVRDSFREKAYNNNEYYTLRIEEVNLKGFIKDLLFSIKEFEELNLSQIEFEKKVSVNDESRPKFSISTRYDKYDSESWKSDFIDLDAFIQNVICNLYMLKESNTDCFCCIHKDTEICKKCNINPNFKNEYECDRQPKEEYTFACKNDCFKSYYICCEECKDKNSCSKKCDCNSKECGLAINRKSK